MSSTPLIRVGPSGWLHPHWDALVYPRPQARGFHALEFLADRFDTVEIDQSFHHFLRPEFTRLWAAKVAHNPRFQFTARLHREFTHERRLEAVDIERFSEGLRPLADLDKLGCVLLQLPASFRFTAENRDYLIRLRRAFHLFPLVAELRHASWTRPEAAGLLIDYRVGFANLDQPQAVWAAPPTHLLTWRVGFVKLHGRRVGPGHEAFDDRRQRTTGNDYLYQTEELEAWQRRIEQFAPFSDSTFVIFNNDGGGKSVINALQMQGLVRSRETGDRSQETGDRSQETGDRSQETGDRSRETGVRRAA